MSLDLDQTAKLNFDERGNSLLARIRLRSRIEQKPGVFIPDFHIAAKLTDQDINEVMRSGMVDATGKETARYFSEGSNEVGLEGENYREFEKLIESIQRTPAFRQSISQTRLKEVAYDWFRNSRKLATSATLCDYIIEICRSEIHDYEVAIPIATLSIEIPFIVGRAVIRPLTKHVLDEWFQRHINPEGNEEERKARESWLIRKRKELQGYSAAFVSVQAEPIRAQEIAIQEAEAALGLLRYFAPGSRSSRLLCACVPLGKEYIQKLQVYSFKDGSLDTRSEKMVNPNWPAWVITAAEVSRMRASHLDALSEIYLDPKTKFHRQIIDTVLLFSRVSTAHELSDKLVILLASLESLFLINQSESIQQNLGERLALITGKDLQEKKEIVETTRRIYNLRSKFIHHGEEIDDVALLDKFMLYAWFGIYNAISSRSRFASMEQYLKKIDELKFSH